MDIAAVVILAMDIAAVIILAMDIASVIIFFLTISDDIRFHSVRIRPSPCQALPAQRVFRATLFSQPAFPIILEPGKG